MSDIAINLLVLSYIKGNAHDIPLVLVGNKRDEEKSSREVAYTTGETLQVNIMDLVKF